MNMKKLTFLAASAATLLFAAACTKDGDNKNLDDDNDSVEDYMSTTAGSWWLYGSTDGSITRRVATGKDSLKLNREYNYYENTDTVTLYFKPEYFAKNGSYFLTLVDLDGSATNYMEVIVSKDSAVQGDEFTNTGDITYSGVPIDLKAEGTVTATGLTMTIGSHTYTDVMQITNALKAKLSVSPIWTDCGTTTAWFKRGVGIIKTNYDVHILTFFNQNYTDSLLDYHIEE
ncbi:MAG: hypothetical protein QM642_09650 [Edaphocola sp.]